jgi:hypothetical protein
MENAPKKQKFPYVIKRNKLEAMYSKIPKESFTLMLTTIMYYNRKNLKENIGKSRRSITSSRSIYIKEVKELADVIGYIPDGYEF